MSVTVIILLILLGIVLFLVEFLLVPGVTVAGISGAILLVGSVILAYHYHGPVVGNYILLFTIVFSIASIYFALKSKTWRKVMLTSNIDSRVDTISPNQDRIKAGDEGETVTRLNPMGKVMVREEVFEGKALDSFIDQRTPIVVIRVENNRLIVKPKNK